MEADFPKMSWSNISEILAGLICSLPVTDLEEKVSRKAFRLTSLDISGIWMTYHTIFIISPNWMLQMSLTKWLTSTMPFPLLYFNGIVSSRWHKKENI